MDYKHNKEIVPLAKSLRKNMTKEEKLLWYDYLREYPVRFIRQKVIGKYIVDFYCAKAKIVLELDGSQHYEDKGIEKDGLRTKFLEQYGLKVIRISNFDINKNFEGVCMFIDNEVKQSLSQLRWQLPLHKGAFLKSQQKMYFTENKAIMPLKKGWHKKYNNVYLSWYAMWK